VSLKSGIPDLLHRFIATPLTFTTGTGESLIRLETNDPIILDGFRSHFHNFPHPYAWKLIRDDVTSRGDEITVIVSGTLVTVLLGAHTCVVVDRDWQRVVGFLASDVDAGKFLHQFSQIIAKGRSQ
jgi:hypothetical protein